MRILIVGQKSFGAAVFDRLSALPGHEVVAVIAPLDDKLRDRAASSGVSAVLYSARATAIRAFDTDVIVNAHGHVYVSRAVREAAIFGAIGYHPSLLPQHRGRSAVEWTIAYAEYVTGGTVYQLDSGWDTGPVIAQDWCHVDPAWTASDLWRERLFPMGVDLLERVIRQSEDPECWPCKAGKPQDERFATHEPPWSGEPRRSLGEPA